MASIITLRRTRSALLHCPLLFVAIGPAIGYAALFGMDLMMSVLELGSGEMGLEVRMVVGLLPLAYAIGSPAALLTGFLYALLAIKKPGFTRGNLRRAVAPGLIGGIAAWLSASWLFGSSVTVALPGLAAGIGCGLLVHFEDPVAEPLSGAWKAEQ